MHQFGVFAGGRQLFDTFRALESCQIQIGVKMDFFPFIPLHIPSFDVKQSDS